MRCGAKPIDGRNRLSLYINKADDVIEDGILNFWEKPSVQKNKLMRRFETWGKEFHIRFSMKVWKPPGPANDTYGQVAKWPPVNHLNLLRFTSDLENYLPGVFLTKKGKTKIAMRVYIQKTMKDINLELYEHHNIALVHKEGIFYCYLDGVEAWKYKWKLEIGDLESKDVNWYLSDPYWNSAGAAAEITDLFISGGKM